MQAEETKMILRYFGGIEAQLDDVNIELAELRDRYNPIKGIAMDGMPHGSTPGDSTASLAVKLADDVEYLSETKNDSKQLSNRLKWVAYKDCLLYTSPSPRDA